MKQKTLIIYSIIFFALLLFGFALIIQFSTSMSLADFVSQLLPQQKVSISTTKCTATDAIAGIANSSEVHLKKLNEYQAVCNSFVTDTMMVFMDMPKDDILADTKAHDLAVVLKEFATYKVKPLIIVEPVTEWGLIDFEEFDTGFYDGWIDRFAAQLKAGGVTDDMIGTWVPFPEANLPYWNRANATPQQFASVVNRYLRIIKNHFPTVQGSVLLNSATYESSDFNWENGEYVSLVPYVTGLDNTLVQSFGIQGFPWRTDATSKTVKTIYDAQEFINPTLAIEAANALGTKDIWVNTGTFSSKFTLDATTVVFIDSATRRTIMDSILKQLETLKNQGFNVSVNLFAEDKSNTDEATNWSYWGNYQNYDDPNIYVFKDFVKELQDKSINLWLFDTYKASAYDTTRSLR